MKINTLAFASIFLLLAALTNTTIIKHLSYLIQELMKMW